MTSLICFTAGVVYAIMAAITFGGTLGYFQSKYAVISASEYPADVRFAIFMASNPVGWVVAFWKGEFYRRGFQFGRRNIAS